MLFGRVVYQDVDPGELLDGFRDGLSTELFLADVACNQHAFAAVFFHQAFCFVRILFFFEIDHCNICAFFRESYGNGPAYPAVAAGDDRYLIPQFFTGAIRFILSLRAGPHFIFPARLLMLALARLKFPFVRHRIPVHRKLPDPSQRRRRLRVRAAFFAAAERECAERRAEARFACRDNAFFDAARRSSRLSAALVARERVREVLLRPPCGSWQDHAWLGFSFASCPASVGATLLQVCAPLTDRWRSLAVGNVHRVRLREYVPFPRARIRLPGWREICLRVRLDAPFRLALLPAYQFVSLPTTHLDVTKNAWVTGLFHNSTY